VDARQEGEELNEGHVPRDRGIEARSLGVRDLALWLFLALVAVQGLLFARHTVRPIARSAWAIRDQPAWMRSATLLEGSDFAGYVAFLRQTIPEDARVLLPPRSVYSPMAHVGLMQYFLFPRDIHNCGVNEVEACILRVRESAGTYVLSLQRFPPRELASQTMRYVAFDDGRGVFVPKGE